MSFSCWAQRALPYPDQIPGQVISATRSLPLVLLGCDRIMPVAGSAAQKTDSWYLHGGHTFAQSGKQVGQGGGKA